MIEDAEFTRDEMFAELNDLFNSIFKKFNPEQNYSLEAIHNAFRELKIDTPEIIVRAYHLLNQSDPPHSLARMELITQLTATSKDLVLLSSQYRLFLKKARVAFYPPKTYNGKDRTETERKYIMEAKLAPVEAVIDIVEGLAGHCGKVTLMSQQSMLAFEKTFIAEYLKSLAS